MCGGTREMSVFSERVVYGFSAVRICYFILCGFNFIMDPGGVGCGRWLLTRGASHGVTMIVVSEGA